LRWGAISVHVLMTGAALLLTAAAMAGMLR